MKNDKQLWRAYCRKRWKCKTLIDTEDTISTVRAGYLIGYADGYAKAMRDAQKKLDIVTAQHEELKTEIENIKDDIPGRYRMRMPDF